MLPKIISNGRWTTKIPGIESPTREDAEESKENEETKLNWIPGVSKIFQVGKVYVVFKKWN